MFQSGVPEDFSWSFVTESGYYVSPVTGDGNIYGLPGCFSCAWISNSTASCGMDTQRTEVSVLGRERVGFPLGFLMYACLWELPGSGYPGHPGGGQSAQL